MDKLKNILIMFFVTISLASSAGLFMLKNTAINEKQIAEDQLFKEKVATKKVKEKLDRTKADRDGLKKSVEQAKQEAQELEQELVMHKRSIDSAEQQLTVLDKDVMAAEQKLSSIEKNTEGLEQRIAGLLKDRSELSEELGLLEKTTQALKTKLAQYIIKTPTEEDIIESPKQMTEDAKEASIIDEDTAAYGDTVAGEILTVNREFDFVVISLGEKDGIQKGMLFNIYRDEEVIGQAKVETIRTNISAAGVTSRETISEIRAGDKAYPALTA
jgi:hypothetical protein